MNHDTANQSSNRSSSSINSHNGPRRSCRRSMLLLASALALGGTAATLSAQPGGAAARYPAPTEAEARQHELGWAMSTHFPNVRAWPESFGSLAFPNRCLFISVVVCP